MIAVAVLTPLFIALSIAQVIDRDDMANIGDRLDENSIPAQEELRREELPNLPDAIDENDIPAKSEERQREEEIKPVRPKGYEILKDEHL